MNPKSLSQPAGDCDSVQELIPAYAFGLTDPDENRLVEANLAGCSDASINLAEYQQLQNEMRASVTQIDPPPLLIGRLAAATVTPPVVVKKTRRLPVPLPWLAAAAALVALVLTNSYWLTRVNTLTKERADYLANDTDNPNTVGIDGGAFVLTNTSQLRWVRLPDARQDGKAAAFLCWNAESQTGLLYVWGFPSPTPGSTYQLWLTRGDVRASAGTFQVDNTGRTVVLFHSSEPIDKYTWARITAEPENGSEQPSTNVVVNGQL